jgi:hypothetical protein
MVLPESAAQRMVLAMSKLVVGQESWVSRLRRPDPRGVRAFAVMVLAMRTKSIERTLEWCIFGMVCFRGKKLVEI